MDILKNPIIIGLLAGALTYAYLTWVQNDKNEKYKKKNKPHKIEEVNLFIPLIVSIIGWFIAYAYLENDDTVVNIVNTVPTSSNVVNVPDINNGNNTFPIMTLPNLKSSYIPKMPMPLQVPQTAGYNFVKDVLSDSSDPKEFSLLTGGVTIPNKLPDVLLELY
jgi:hypothetical protein